MAKDQSDFTQATKDKVLRRAGCQCSFPGCALVLVGPHSDGDGTVFTGEVAHIQGARPGSNNRFNAHMSPEERRHHSNAIVLCRTHAKLIDSDEEKYTTQKLYAWKIDHEAKITRQQAGENVDDEYVDKPYDKCTDEELILDRDYRKELIRNESQERAKTAFKAFAFSVISALIIFIWHTINGGWSLYMFGAGIGLVLFPALGAFKLMEEKTEFMIRQENTIRDISYRLKERGAE